MVNQFDDKSFWRKTKSTFKKAGRELVEKVLQLYYAAQKPETPARAKAIIYGALAYFISPIDAIPDVLPGGYVDDLGVLSAAIVQVSMYIDKDVKKKAKKKVKKWFG